MAKQVAALGPVEGPWALPEGWRWERLGAVARIVAGQSPPSAQVNRQGNGLPFFQGKAEFGAERPVARNWCPTPTKIAEPGDVLISVRAPVGPTNYAPEHCGIGRGLAAIHPQSLSPRYVRYWLVATRHVLREKATGTTFEAITGDVLRHHAIPIPPVGQDRPIAARIDELFAEIDDGEAALARARDDLTMWRRALLKAAVTGELTADWRAANPPTETGAELLARILGERRAQWEGHPKTNSKQYKEAVDVDTHGLAALPDGWTWTSVDHLTADQLIGMDRGRSLQSKDSAHGAAYVKMNNVTMDGRVLWENLRYVEASKVDVSRFGLNQGDILFNTRNSLELVGKVGLITNPPVGAVYNNNLLRLRLGTVVDPAFVTLQMTALPFRKKLEEVKRATTSVAAIYVNALLPLPLAIPPLKEQREIVRRIQDVMHVGMADALDLEATNLRQSILAAAFRGELA